ncbi:MAG TPA: helix-turn-helix transcriptional regulator [Candidatus Hydrogenedentes bacterium]|nr:helix-turn-helix transcriptional regulator [Candidatus Hydrogenedentota bacterium]
MTTGEQRILKRFGRAVREHRHKLGISQEKLAEYADLHRTYVADVERGNRNIGLVNIVRLAAALKVTPGQLINPCSDFESNDVGPKKKHR